MILEEHAYDASCNGPAMLTNNGFAPFHVHGIPHSSPLDGQPDAGAVQKAVA